MSCFSTHRLRFVQGGPGGQVKDIPSKTIVCRAAHLMRRAFREKMPTDGFGSTHLRNHSGLGRTSRDEAGPTGTSQDEGNLFYEDNFVVL
jgi:hypothetical protein